MLPRAEDSSVPMSLQVQSHSRVGSTLTVGGTLPPPKLHAFQRCHSFLLTLWSTELSYCVEWQDSANVTAPVPSTAQACHCHLMLYTLPRKDRKGIQGLQCVITT